MGKALIGELSCLVTGLLYNNLGVPVIVSWNKFKQLLHIYYLFILLLWQGELYLKD